MNDLELEDHIADTGKLMLQSYARYDVSGCFSDLGDAHHWRLAMETAIKSRSAEQVARMEVERGLNS